MSEYVLREVKFFATDEEAQYIAEAIHDVLCDIFEEGHHERSDLADIIKVEKVEHPVGTRRE